MYSVTYAAFESLTVPINSANNKNDIKSFTEAYQHHEPCGLLIKLFVVQINKIILRKKYVEKFFDCLMQETKILVNKIINQNRN